MALLNRAIRNARAMMRAAEWGDSSIPPNSAGTDFSSSLGGASGEGAALGISTVFACLKALHDDVTTLPFMAYEGERFGPHQPLKIQPRIVTEPFGPDVAPEVGFGQLAYSKAARGNAYAFVVATDPKTGLPDQTTILHPDAVHPTRDRKGVKCFKIGPETYYSDKVIHMTGLMQPGAVAGIDVLTAQRLLFDLALKVGQYADGFFGGGGSPAGVISVKESGNRKKAREVKEAWEAGHAGVANAHRPAVLFGGATWQQLSVSPENAQFLETRRFLREEVCGLYNVPLHRIQAIIDNAAQGGGKGLDALDAGYIRHGILPLLRSIEIAWNRMIPGGLGSWTGFYVDEFLRANASDRATIANQQRVSGIRTIDEIRASDGLEPYPDGLGSNPFSPLNSNASPAGGADNAPAPGSTP
ncbi:phage portal protein [Jatrophihabitans sp. DSM 45814]